jgi:hypothetical protein
MFSAKRHQTAVGAISSKFSNFGIAGNAQKGDQALKKLARGTATVIALGTKPDRETLYYLVRVSASMSTANSKTSS